MAKDIQETIEYLENIKKEMTEKYELAQDYMLFDIDPNALNHRLGIGEGEDPTQADNYNEIIDKAKYYYKWLKDAVKEVVKKAGNEDKGYYFQTDALLNLYFIYTVKGKEYEISTADDIESIEVNKTIDAIIEVLENDIYKIYESFI